MGLRPVIHGAMRVWTPIASLAARQVRRAARGLLTVLLLAAITSPPSLADASRELRLWIEKPDPGLEATIREWERRHRPWRVEVGLYAGGKNAQQLMTAIVGGDPPDVIQQDRFTIGEWAAREAFLPLDELIEADVRAAEANGAASPLDPDRFYPACWAEAVYRGRTYGIPYSTDSRALIYHEDLLRDAGFVDEHGEVIPPRNWDQLREYTARLTRRDATGRLLTLGFAPNYGNSWLYLWGWLNGGRFLSEDGRTVLLDSPPIVKALTYIAELYDLAGGIGEVDRFVGSATGLAFEPLPTGRLAMQIDGVWTLAEYAEYHPHLRFGVAPPPAPAGRDSVTWAGGFCYAIPRNCDHPREAMSLIRFLLSDEGWAIYHRVNRHRAAARGRGYIPPMAAQPHINAIAFGEQFAQDPNLPPRVIEGMHVFLDVMDRAHYRPVTPVGQLLWDQQARAIDLTLRGGLDPRAALTRAAQSVQHRLDVELAPRRGAPVRWAVVIGVGVVAVALVLIAAPYLAAGRRRIGKAFPAGRTQAAPPPRRWRWGETRAAMLFASPWLVGFALLTAGPMFASLLLSLTHYDGLSTPRWAGLTHYQRLLTDDPIAWHALLNTAYMLIGVPAGMAVGLAMALLLNAPIRGMPVYRTLFYLPAIIPLVAASVLWVWVLNPELGLVNSLLRLAGLTDLPGWLTSPSWWLGSKAAIILMGLWTAGSGMVIWLAGLQAIPGHLYEAARIDGAGPLRRFRHVTLPMLSPYLLFNLIVGTIATMQIFTQAMVMTRGGPADSTLFFAYYLFNVAFAYFNMGYASALAWLLLLITLALTLALLASSRYWVHHENP